MRGYSGPLRRRWYFDTLLNPASDFVVILDASPYGLGGVLLIKGIIVSWFSDPLTNEDSQRFRKKLGGAEGQQIWESFCVLVALRLWLHHWMHVRAAITIKSDNISALAMAIKLKESASGLLARELALSYTQTYFQHQCERIPGAMNYMADALSRLSDPFSKGSVPEALASVPRAYPDKRDDGYFHTLAV